MSERIEFVRRQQIVCIVAGRTPATQNHMIRPTIFDDCIFDQNYGIRHFSFNVSCVVLVLFGVVRGIMVPTMSDRPVLFFDIDNCVSKS